MSELTELRRCVAGISCDHYTHQPRGVDGAFVEIEAAETRIAQLEQANATLTTQLAEARRERDALKYEPDGQLRANLSNDAVSEVIQQLADSEKAAEALRALLRQAQAVLKVTAQDWGWVHPQGGSIKLTGVTELLREIDAALATAKPERAGKENA